MAPPARFTFTLTMNPNSVHYIDVAYRAGGGAIAGFSIDIKNQAVFATNLVGGAALTVAYSALDLVILNNTISFTIPISSGSPFSVQASFYSA